jgi:hypothetical protein
MTVCDELEIMCKETSVVCFLAPYQLSDALKWSLFSLTLHTCCPLGAWAQPVSRSGFEYGTFQFDVEVLTPTLQLSGPCCRVCGVAWR